ncbi:hypothetical protein F5Y14DRAFT_428207 [Nemania sp. NC0429]|nr:hypothetical protein F5Y14DRAFT_428207 [Nemania sp. NC0429]
MYTRVKAASLRSSGWALQASPHSRRATVESPTFDLTILFGVILSAALVAIVAVVGSLLYYRRAKRKRDQDKDERKSHGEEPGTTASFEKPELSGDPSVMIHEMNAQGEHHELAEEGDCQRHELPDDRIPQELLGSEEGLNHELPGEECSRTKPPAAAATAPTAAVS